MIDSFNRAISAFNSFEKNIGAGPTKPKHSRKISEDFLTN